MGGSSKCTSKTGKLDVGDIAAATSNTPEYRKICKSHVCFTIAVKTATHSQKHVEVWLFRGTLMSSSDPLRKAGLQHSSILMFPLPKLK